MFYAGIIHVSAPVNALKLDVRACIKHPQPFVIPIFWKHFKENNATTLCKIKVVLRHERETQKRHICSKINVSSLLCTLIYCKDFIVFTYYENSFHPSLVICFNLLMRKIDLRVYQGKPFILHLQQFSHINLPSQLLKMLFKLFAIWARFQKASLR